MNALKIIIIVVTAPVWVLPRILKDAKIFF